ncbi:hypothetical protein Scep_007668 [Stephania cephalantha]|uniref:Uncharacterized protein n=1 Tax=Stephania cephalantha TaxID=152367 RepID=A0AAP0KAB2_9MAGN
MLRCEELKNGTDVETPHSLNPFSPPTPLSLLKSLSQNPPLPAVRVICIVNARGKLKNPPLSEGTAGTRSCSRWRWGRRGGEGVGAGVRGEEGEECEGEVTEEYVRSVADMMVERGGLTSGDEDVLGVGHDQGGVRGSGFRVGKAVYGGPPKGGMRAIPGVASFFIPSRRCRCAVPLVAALSPPLFVAALETIAVCLRPLPALAVQPPPLFAALRRCSSLPGAAKMANEINPGPNELANIPCSPLMNVAI